MGLDMYAYKTRTALKRLDFIRTRDAVQFHYWRKHYGLHAFMEQLYRSQGGTGSFNLVPLLLEPADIDALEAAVMEGATLVRIGTALFGPRMTAAQAA